MKTLRTTALLIAVIGLLLSSTFAASPADQNLVKLSENLTAAYALQHDASTLTIVTADQMNESNPFAMLYSHDIEAMINQPALQILAGRDAAVIVVNTDLPNQEQWLKNGISLQALRNLLQSQPKAILFSNDQVLNLVQKFTNQNLDRTATKMAGSSFLNELKSSDNSFGICMLSDVLEANQQLVPNIALVPFDKNDNGVIDSPEAFYDNQQVFARALWLGKYPKALTQNIVMVSNKKELSSDDKNFINWFMTSGQKTLATNGIVALNPHEQVAELKKIEPAPLKHETAQQETQHAWILVLLVMIGGLMAFAMLVLWIFIDRRAPIETTGNDPKGSFGLQSMKAPKGLMYDKGHLWAFMEDSGTVKIGFDDFIRHIFGDITLLEPMPVGKHLVKGEHLITLSHQGKQVVLTSPLAGKVVEVNTSLTRFNENISDNWIYKIEPMNWQREVGFLLMFDQYTQWMKTEFNRFKDFLALTMQAHSLQQASIILQDGGILQEGLMTEMEPEIWEDFQNQFLKSNQ